MIIALLPGSANADDKIFKWILKQYEAKNVTVIDSQVGGLIDEEAFIAVVARDVDPELDIDTSGKKQYLGLFKQSQDKLVGVALARLAHVGDQNHPRVEIKNNSIFITTTYCHHGCTSVRYQFNSVGKQFKLVGVEYLSGTTFAEYAGIENYLAYCAEKPDCDLDVASGRSYNFLSSTSVCWLQTASLSKPSPAPQSPYQPRGVQHKMPFKKVDLRLLDGFDIETFSLPKSCYFDFRKKLRVDNP